MLYQNLGDRLPIPHRAAISDDFGGGQCNRIRCDCAGKTDWRNTADWCKGDVYDWGEDAARTAIPLRKYKPNEVIDPAKFKRDNLETGELLLRKAGYRLAKVLNDIFE